MHASHDSRDTGSMAAMKPLPGPGRAENLRIRFCGSPSRKAVPRSRDGLAHLRRYFPQRVPSTHPLRGATTMSAPRGKFIWYDVMTSDTKAATAFYSDVIGWDAQEHAMPDNRTYTVFSKGPAMVAGLMAIPEELCADGAKPCWSGYVATDNVDADAARVAAAGGAIKRPPTDIPNVGRFAVVADPGGAVFLLFKPNTEEEPKPVAPMTPGHVGWHELYAGNLDREF